MKSMKLREYLICISALILAPNAMANDLNVAAKWHFGLDYAASVKYHEPGMSETGSLTGIFFDWDIAPARTLTVLGNFTVLYGGLTYDGATQSGIPLKSSSTDHIFTGELAVGLHVGAKKNGTLYAGIGERYWTDIISDAIAVTGAQVSGYRREITYMYAPVGARVRGELGGHWHLEIDTKYMALLRGEVVTHLENVDPGFNTLENKQHHGRGYAVGLRFTHGLENNPTFTQFFVEPYYQAWIVPRSDNATLYFYGVPIGYGYEPENATRIVGLRLGLIF